MLEIHQTVDGELILVGDEINVQGSFPYSNWIEPKTIDDLKKTLLDPTTKRVWRDGRYIWREDISGKIKRLRFVNHEGGLQRHIYPKQKRRKRKI